MARDNGRRSTVDESRLIWHEPQDAIVLCDWRAAPVAIARGDVEVSVRPADDVAEAPEAVLQEPLDRLHAPRVRRVEPDPQQRLSPKRGHEQVVAKRRKRG